MRLITWGIGGGAAASVMVGLVVAVVGIGHAAPVATCTFEQKQARTKAVAAYQHGMRAVRAAYFRKQSDPRKRAAFVKKQQRKLRTLRAAAGCTVAPLPPSSSASCAPELAPHPGGSGHLSEAPIDPRLRQAAVGRVDSVGLFLDYPDAPGAPAAPGTLAPSLDPEPAWFREVSHGRLEVALTPVLGWIRMPAPMSSYLPLNNNERVYRYVRDAVTAADPLVDFSRYNHVTFANSGNFPTFGAFLLTNFRGAPPLTADGTEIRFGVFLPTDAQTVARFRNFWIHEQLHVHGLPDLGGLAVGWDPISYGLEPPALTHLLGWHKWLLRWIDPPQLTCVTAPGIVEETLTPIAVPGGKKLVVVPIRASFAYAVEARRRIGYDRNACDEGVVVYSIDSQRGGYEDPIVLRGPRRCGNVTPGAFKTGGVHEDQSVKVEVLATDGRNYRVRVTKK